MHPDVPVILIGSQHLLQDSAELHLPPGSPRLDIGQYPFQITHAGRQVLHFTQSALYRLQALADKFEGFTQTLLQRALQFFIHRLAHLL